MTQPELVWTYSEDGIVKIDRKVNGAWKRDESAKDNGLFLASSEYYIYAEGTGTVTATGTPVDTTAGAKPVTVTITVTKGTAPKVDTEKLIRSGVKKAVMLTGDADTVAKQVAGELESVSGAFVCVWR